MRIEKIFSLRVMHEASGRATLCKYSELESQTRYRRTKNRKKKTARNRIKKQERRKKRRCWMEENAD
jgi:hypothetical protein